jgi:glycerol-3-phosphate acyltransferase PlsY
MRRERSDEAEPRSRHRLGVPLVVAASYVSGAVPVMNTAARLVRGVDLRAVGSGTVSGTALARGPGLRALGEAGALAVAKRVDGPSPAGRRRPVLQAVAGAATIVGHDWSAFLGGAGGRGIAPAVGVLLATEPLGVPALLGALVAGRFARQSGIGTLVGLAGLVPIAGLRRGRAGILLVAGLAVPMVAKRLTGNAPPAAGAGPAVYLWRLLLDRDCP